MTKFKNKVKVKRYKENKIDISGLKEAIMPQFNLISVYIILTTFAIVNVVEVKASTEYNRYLAHIFHKYGSGGTMSFEGLEHLMYSLGLGQIEFEEYHTIEQHHPNGLKDNHEEQIKSYMDIQTIKLLSDDDDDVQIAQINIQKKNVDQETVAEKSKQDKDIFLEFKEMHDPKHRHPRENEASVDGGPLSSNVCLSPKSLLRLVVDHDDLHKRKLYKTFTSSFVAASSSNPKLDVNNDHDLEEEYNHFVNNVRLTPMAFMKLCPALLAQIDQQVCIHSLPLTHNKNTKGITWNVWIYASAAIFILSACGLLGILLVPLMKTVAYQEILNFLVAVAVGTLSGDALMHLIPHALGSQHSKAELPEHHNKEEATHKHDTSIIWICACAFFTALFMYVIETVLPLLRGDRSAGSHGHSHQNHSHETVQKSNEKSLDNQIPALGAKKVPEPPSTDARELNIMLNEAKLDTKKPSRPLTPVAFMVIIGDGLHNLTDGLAIGAAFASASVTGLATAFAVLCHELPHELGDFALLLQTGVSIRRAICLNIASSILSFVGMTIGILIAGLHTNMTKWIYAGTAGSFLYIAFADLVPAMANTSNGKLKSSLVQVLGIIIGGFIMLVIAINEDTLERLFN